jgi:Ni/Fe-hydrogenase subunit HybB-like protein
MRTRQSHTAPENRPFESTLKDRGMPVQAQLAAAWTSLMFLVIYIDYFHLYQPGEIDEIRGGVIFAFDISGTLMSIFFAVIAIPALMVMLSIMLPARVNRVTNLVVASLYIPVMVFNAAGATWDYAFYYALTIGVEVLILAFILRAAGTWSRRIASAATTATSLDSEPRRTPERA